MSMSFRKAISFFLILSIVLAISGTFVSALAAHSEHALCANHHHSDNPRDHDHCADHCLCLCCPGHANALLSTLETPIFFAKKTAGYVWGFDHLLSSGVTDQVFRPPRVV